MSHRQTLSFYCRDLSRLENLSFAHFLKGLKISHTCEALSFSVAGTSSTSSAFPSFLHSAARYLLGLLIKELGTKNSLLLAEIVRAKGRKSLSGTV